MSEGAVRNHQSVVGIQYARGVAALLVVLYHIAEQMKSDPIYGGAPHEVLEFGFIGVPIFFVISGFIIAVVSLSPTLSPRLSIASFIEKRSVRILPFMWIAIVVYNVLSFSHTHVVEWGPFIRAMTLWPSGTVKPNVIWTLRHEALFYLIFAISFLGGRRRLWLTGIWCLSPILFALLSSWDSDPGAPVGAPSFPSLIFSDVNLAFGAGLLIGLYTLLHGERMRATWPGGALIVYAGGAILALASWMLGWRFGLGHYLGITALATILIVIATKLAPSTGLPDRLATLLGNASYAIYLTHNMVIVPALVFGHRSLQIIGIWPTYAAIALAAIIAGIIIHFLIEKPLLTLISRRIPRRSRPFVEAGR